MGNPTKGETNTKNRNGPATAGKFNKKKFRDMKYNKKYKIKEWEQQREKYIKRKYQKDLRKQNIHVPKSNENQPHQQHTQRVSVLQEAQQKFQKIKEVKEKMIEENLTKKQEMEEAIKRYKLKKAEKFKKLSRKTKKGQPVMKHRLELLYEEIKQKIAPESCSE